jgi:hypothetical protein
MTSKRKRYSAEFKAEVALEALDRFGKPEIFNTDRGGASSPRHGLPGASQQFHHMEVLHD